MVPVSDGEFMTTVILCQSNLPKLLCLDLVTPVNDEDFAAAETTTTTTAEQ